jgi:hypothetical protein
MHCFESVTFLYESTADPDTARFFSEFQDANTKVKFCPKFFYFILTEGTGTVFKEKKS